ncbi:MAG TPA: c-type cytochrome, partial [Rhizobiaceae bacterium]|nr:c-type cytochrome [Rhizobiaceae bacterium]
MSKFLNSLLAAIALLALSATAQAADAEAGAKVFKKCAACHAVGEGAKNRVGPILNDIVGRKAGTVEGFKYSPAMVAAGEGGLVWNDESIASYMKDPKGFVPKNKMAFAGLKKDDEIADLIAYLKTFSAAGATEVAPAAAPATETASAPTEQAPAAEATPAATAAETAGMVKSKGKFGIGRQATDAEIKAWNVDVSPDGTGLPEGSGSVEDGEGLFSEHCAACHGEFAEGVDNWPKLAGGEDTLADDDPLKTVGSYWPYLSTTWDYVHRSMPFGGAGVLSDDETYAIVAYILYSNNLVDEDFVLSKENFLDVKMPNAGGFIVD